jgi:hypothetical protein
MRRAQAEDWNLLALDQGIDLSTPAGEFLANVMASAAQWERRIIGQRTREGLAARRPVSGSAARGSYPTTWWAGWWPSGPQDGRWPPSLMDLPPDGVPTAQGGARWYPATVQKVLARVPSG